MKPKPDISIAVDIGNTNLKTLTSLTGENWIHRWYPIPPGAKDLDYFVSERLLRYETPGGVFNLHAHNFPRPITWRIIQTGSLDWQELKAEILKVRPKDKIKSITRSDIPLKIDVDYPDKVGIDRLVAAYAAQEIFGNAPKLIVDAGTAITVDLVHEQTFCGGVIFPGLSVMAETYPRISSELPKVEIPMSPGSLKVKLPMFPGKNTEDAILTGIYWGAVGTIRLFYESVRLQKSKLRVILTGGDAEYLLQGLNAVLLPENVEFCETLVLGAILQLLEEGKTNRSRRNRRLR